MADETVVDELQIKITADTTDIDKKIDNLKKTFGGITRNAQNSNGQNMFSGMQKGIEKSTMSLMQQQKYVDGLREKFANLGKSWSFNGTLSETEKKIKTIEQRMADVRTTLEGQKIGTKGYENSIKTLSTLSNQLEIVKQRRDELLGKSLGQLDTSDIDAAIQRMNDRILAEKASQEDVTSEVDNTTESVNRLDYALKNSLSSFQKLSIEAENAKSSASGIEKQPLKELGGYDKKELKSGQRYTKDFLDLSKTLDKANGKLESLYTRLEKADSVGTKRTSAGYKNLQYEIQKTEKEVQNLETKMKNLQASGGDIENAGFSFGVLGDKARESSNFLTQLSAALRGAGFRGAAQTTSSIGRNFANMAKNAEGATGAVAGIGGALPYIALAVGAVALLGKTLKKIIGLGVSVGKTIASVMKNIVARVMDVVKAFAGMGGATTKIGKLINKFTMTLRNRGISKIVMAIFNQAKESIQSLAAFSNRIGSNFNKNLSSLIANFKLLGNSMVAAFEPILNVITPILNKLIGTLVTATNYVNQFFSALTGSSTWTKAIYKAVNYGESVEDASKAQEKLNKQLQGFDELNNLSTPNDNNAGSGGGASAIDPNQFTTEEVQNNVSDFVQKFKDAWAKADFTEIGEIVAGKIQDALNSIKWDKIQTTADKLGSSLATFLNGFFGKEGFANDLGNAIAQAVNTGIGFVTSFIDKAKFDVIGTFVGETIVSALSNIKWESVTGGGLTLGRKLAEGVNALLSTDVLNEISKAVANLLITGVNAWYGFVTAFDFSQLGTKIGSSINDFFMTMSAIDPTTGLTGWQKLGQSISKSIVGIVDSVSTAVKTVDWTLVGQSIRDMIEKIDWKKITFELKGLGDEIGKAVYEVITGKDFTFKNVLFTFKDIQTKFEGLADGSLIVDAVLRFAGKNFGISDNTMDLVGSITSIAKAPTLSNLIDLVANVTSFVKDKDFVSKITGMTAEFSSWVKQQGGFKNVIGDMIAKFVDFILPQPFKWVVDKMTAKFTNKDDSAVDKTSTGWTAQFTKGKVSIKRKDKKVGGLTGIVSSIKSALTGNKKDLGVVGKISSLNTDSVRNAEVQLKGNIVPETVTVGGKTYLVTTNKDGKRGYYNDRGQWNYAEKGGVFSLGAYRSIAQYANGGMPSHGTHFVAGENGAEVVGHIGGRTEVLNQSQLASTMYSAVVAAMTQVYGNGQQPIQVLLDGKVVFDNTRQRANEYFRKTGNPAFSC